MRHSKSEGDMTVAQSPSLDAAKPYGVHQLDPWFMAHYQKGCEVVAMGENAGRAARFFNMLQMLQLTRGIAGATAEAGCFRGLASLLMCHSLRFEAAEYDGRGHFMIDSFEGLSQPIGKDGDFSKLRHGQGAFTRTSRQQCCETLADFPAVEIIQGWIPQAFEQLPEQTYRFAHIDVDLYEPTLDGLRYFYPRLAPGGMIVVDDYGPWPDDKWAGCKMAVEEFCAQQGVPFGHLDTGNAVIVKR